MRVLNEYEVNLIAGGWGSSSDDIVITGWRMHWEDFSWFTIEIGGGGGGAEPEPEPVDEPNPTPCVETSLSNGISTTDANRAALAASNKIAELNDEMYEYSSIIWWLNGEIGFTAPYQGSPSEVNWLGGLDGVPDGAVIIGILHNHPDEPGIDDRIPSPTSLGGQDWTAYDQLRNWGGTRGITVDQNLLQYVYTNEDGKTRVYDKTDKETQQASCTLQ